MAPVASAEGVCRVYPTKEVPVTAVMPARISSSPPSDDNPRPNDAELAAAAFLSRYQGRTLDAYR